MAKDPKLESFRGGCPIPGLEVVQELEKGAPIPTMQPAAPAQPQSQQTPQPGTSNQGADSVAGSGDKK
jgi:hypothetical protein